MNTLTSYVNEINQNITFINKPTLESKSKEDLLTLLKSNFKISKNKYNKCKNFDKAKLIAEIIKLQDSEVIKNIKALKLNSENINEYSKLSINFNNDDINDATQNVKDRIHEIHNFIRNKGFGYGMTGLKVFNMIYGLLQIEASGILKDYKFGTETLKNVNMTNQELIDALTFSKIYEKVKSYKPELLNETDKMYFSELISNICNLLYKFKSRKDNKLKNLIYYDLTRLKYSGEDLKLLFEKINDLHKFANSSNIQLGGKIYEYFVGRDDTAISELGAYFTDRHLVNYIFDKILNLDNLDLDNIPSMVDMYGGSGGFTVNFIVKLNKLLQQKYNGNYNHDQIKSFWKENIKKINHNDVNGDVVNNAKLESFCLTHQVPSSNNFKVSNSFTNEFSNKYKLIISNPPYGGDKCEETDEIKMYNKIISYNKKELETVYNDNKRTSILFQNYLLEQEIKNIKENQKAQCVNYNTCSKVIRDYCDKITEFENEYRTLTGKTKIKPNEGYNDKESCSLVLLMALCETGGKVLGVLKEGVFFDGKYSHIRRYLLKHFIIKRIDSNPKDAFENTGTKTSNILFELPEDGIIPEDYNIDFYDVDVVKNTEDVYGNNNNFTNLSSSNDGTISEVNAKFVKSVSVKKILVNKDLSFNPNQYNNIDLVPADGFKIVSFLNNGKFDKKSIHKASVAKLEGKYPFYTSSNTIKYSEKCDYKDLSLIIGTGGNGSLHLGKNFSCSTDNFVINFNNDLLTQYQYYILKCNWNYLVSLMNGSTIKHITKGIINDLQLPIPKEQKDIEYWVNHISQPYNKLQECKTKLQTLEDKVKLDIQNILDNNETEEVMLGELCEFIKFKKYNTSYGKSKGKYKFYNSSETQSLYCDNFEIKEKSIIIGFKGNINIHIDKLFTPSQHVYVLQLKNNNTYDISIKYLMYIYKFLKLNKSLFTNNMHGSTISHITKNDVKKIKIQLPKDRSILDTLNPVFEEIDQMNAEIPKQEELYNSRLEELRKAAIKS
jgi:hypothetical protein